MAARGIRATTGFPGTGKRRRRIELVLLVLLVAITMSLLSFTGPFNLLDLRSFDYLSTLDPPAPDPRGPVIVAIDEPSLSDTQSQWPWPRSLHAHLVAELRAAGAKAIGLDIVFAEPSADPANDLALETALGPDVVLAGDETLVTAPQADQLVRTEPLAGFSATGAKTGIASIGLHRDGTFRQVPTRDDGFAAQLAKVAGQAAALPAGEALIQAIGPSRTYPTVSYYQALDARRMLPEGIFRDRVVLVGLSLQTAPTLAAGGADAFGTSFTLLTGRLVSGVEVQASIFDNLVRGLWIARAGTPADLASILIASCLGGAVVARGTGWDTPIFCIVILPVMIAASYTVLRLGHVFVSPIGAVSAFLGVVAGQAAFDYASERRQRRQITRAFSHYLSPALVERLASDPSKLKLGGERRRMTILFCDVRGFTTISEALKDDPERLTTLMNRLLTPLSDVVLAHGGTIDKYIGDCLMAFWNAPLDDPDHAAHAVDAAIDMLAAIETLNAALASESAASRTPLPTLKIGIGINTGDCVVGNMGSRQRFDYSVLGDTVNLASRLEGQSKIYGVPLLIGEETARALSGAIVALELDRIIVKGRTTPSPVFTVLSALPEDTAERHRRFIAAKYAGELCAEDTRFDALIAELPALAPYYKALRAAFT